MFITFLVFLFTPLLADASANLSFREIASHLNLNHNTQLHVETYWRNIQGNEVKWSGVVTNVVGGRGRAEVYVVTSEGQTYKGYNIVINTYDVDRAARLTKGQNIRFVGQLRDYKAKKGHPIIIFLNEGQIQ